jgi:hypothetical protein
VYACLGLSVPFLVGCRSRREPAFFNALCVHSVREPALRTVSWNVDTVPASLTASLQGSVALSHTVRFSAISEHMLRPHLCLQTNPGNVGLARQLRIICPPQRPPFLPAFDPSSKLAESHPCASRSLSFAEPCVLFDTLLLQPQFLHFHLRKPFSRRRPKVPGCGRALAASTSQIKRGPAIVDNKKFEQNKTRTSTCADLHHLRNSHHPVRPAASSSSVQGIIPSLCFGLLGHRTSSNPGLFR